MQDVSQLMDGECEAGEAERQLSRIKTDPARREVWDTYHLIGDALRATAREPVHLLQPGFQARLAEKLAAEPTVLASRARPVPSRVQTWAMSIAASVAAVAAVGWMTMGAQVPDVANSVVAKGTVAPVVPVTRVAEQPALPAVPKPSPVLAAEEQMHVHEYMLAHQGISPSTAIQGVTPYIRTVSNTGD